MDTHHRAEESGFALLAVMLILALLMGIVASLTTSINMDMGLRGGYDRATKGFYAAESGLNRAMGDYRNIFLNFNVPTGSDFAPHSITVGSRTVNFQITETAGNPTSLTIPAGQLFGGLSSQEYDYIVGSAALSNGETESRVNAEFKVGYIPLFQFVAFYKGDLEIAPGADMTLTGRVHTNGSLYLDADGSTLTINDNVATNTTVQVSAQQDIYRGRKRANVCDDGKVVIDKLEDKVSPLGGDLDPLGLNCTAAPSYPAVGGSGSTRKVPSSELASWKGDIINQVSSIAIPEPDIDAKGSGTYWTKADLRIVLNLNNTIVAPGGILGATGINLIEVQDVAGAQDVVQTARLRAFMSDSGWNWTAGKSSFQRTRPIFYTDRPTVLGGPGACNCSDANPVCTNGTATCYAPAFANNNRVYGTGTTMVATSTSVDYDYRRGGFYNWRERKWMYLLNVNLQDLLHWNMDQPAANRLFDPADRTDGGIVLFLSVQGPESNSAANHYGVRVFGSAFLPFPNMGADPTGVTVVSDQAIYVLGSYNSAATLATGKQPTAVIGDSINVLSNAYWQAGTPGAGTLTNDAQSNTSLGGARNAANTVYNTAFIGGMDDTIAGGGSSGYNGGLENYPRFHEGWGGTTITYRGSFVSLGLPRHVNGSWCGTGGSTGSGCNIYNPPSRSYNYETDFNNAANLPPLTPRFVYVQQVLFTEEFK